jgi:mRNA deadenylase 3'-5' endonuclease subunit Ccr4
VLQDIAFPSKIHLIANTHLNFNDRRGDVKMAEIKIVMDVISILKEAYGKDKKQEDLNVIMCGDFNSSPRSGIYEFMRQGYYDCMKT